MLSLLKKRPTQEQLLKAYEARCQKLYTSAIEQGVSVPTLGLWVAEAIVSDETPTAVIERRLFEWCEQGENKIQ